MLMDNTLIPCLFHLLLIVDFKFATPLKRAMNPDVSIIVPCYNVAAYVDECLDSLVRQTLRNIEIICINDGSTDDTLDHLARWREKDERIILLDQQNSGVSAARNAGLDAAQGMYIGFTDPDDYVDPEMYSRLFSAALEHDADIVECGNYVFADASARLIETKRRSPSWHFEPDASPESFFRDSIWGKTDVCVWNKLFRKSMLDAHRLRFNINLKSGSEDETFRLMAVPHAARLLFIPDCLYYYRLMRNGSLSRRGNDPSYFRCVQEFHRLFYIMNYWKNHGWMNAGLFAYGVRKIKPFFVSKHPLFHQMTAVQQQSLLDWWHLFYQKAEGARYLPFLMGRDRQLVELLNSAKTPANGWGRILLAACSLLPGQKGRYYSCKRMLAEHFSHAHSGSPKGEEAPLQEPFDTTPPSL